MNSIVKKVMTLFIAIGTLFFIVGCVIGFRSLNRKNMTAAEAEIVRITTERGIDNNTDYRVYIAFDVDGEEHITEIGTYMSSYRVGKIIKIYYDNDNPDRVVVGADYGISIFICAFGFIFIAVGSLSLIKEHRAYKRYLNNSRTVYATYTKVGINGNYSVNGHNPYVVLCEWTDPVDGKVYDFVSPNLWFDPTDLIACRNITSFPVQIDSEDPSYYKVDISSLQNRTDD